MVAHIDKINTLLKEFQKGYTERNVKVIDDFMALFLDSSDLLVIGTSTTGEGEGEWCRGLQETRELIEGDWKYWGDVDFHFENAVISVIGDCVCVSTTAIVSQIIPFEERYQDYLDFVKYTLERENYPPKRKMLDLTLLGNEVMASVLHGDRGSWPLRFSLTAVKEESDWKIAHMHFSFPCTRSPDEVV